ncbi:acetyl-CoA synthetase-like protein [Rhizopogon vinicolor AM-OR11-026]|uniref:Acetyl-CoA synthetase-like protein n=1 Tax=Rhizopogon vinicolor AM-OR11-026 TaxID=1314800 RepID=A0A1B7MU79_9AGAM|nr:acetyl-CoA synthetase-like protein [Rhizopogon vinicolor AM-OR11-026]
MAELVSPAGTLPHIPDDLTLVQFALDAEHVRKPVRKSGSTWIIDDQSGRKIGLEELQARTYGLANALSIRYNIQEDDVVLIYSPNHVDYLVAVWAAHRLGAAMSGANPLYTVDELVYQINAVQAAVIFTHPDSLEVALSSAHAAGVSADRVILFDVEGADTKQKVTVQGLVTQGLASTPNFTERKLAPGEGKTKVAFLNFSSGTTGRPKAVAIPHYAPIANIIQLATHHRVGEDYDGQRFKPGGICCGVLPLFHIYGLVVSSHYVFFCGMAVVLTPKFNFLEFLESIVRHRMTNLVLVPPQIIMLCKHPAVKDYDLSHVQYITSGAAPLSREVMEQLVQTFPNAAIGQSYGTTESCTVITTWAVDKKRDLTGSAGQLLPGIIGRVEKPDGTLADFDEPGELVVKTQSLALGYANDEKATKETFVNGWLRTGDEVKMNRKGEIVVLDRLKEMLKVRGFQVAPAELEGCILDHPDVTDTCVVGIEDDYSGELPLAFVVLRPTVAKRVEENPRAVDDIKASIMKHVADNKVAYKKLAGGVELIDVIPKNPSGKLLRRVLRAKARDMRTKPKAKL